MKKLLAFILAVTMIATLIPSAFADGGEEKIEIVCDVEELMVALDMYGSSCTLPFSTLNYTNTNGVYSYVDSSIPNDLVASKQITYPGAKPGSNAAYDTKGFI
ncbi:MAG: hypothetical protein IKY53_03455, partial [Lachnospiraceae bacterium]|nr:hypothetical protein [Lachnospiraceae bacterium]